MKNPLLLPYAIIRWSGPNRESFVSAEAFVPMPTLLTKPSNSNLSLIFSITDYRNSVMIGFIDFSSRLGQLAVSTATLRFHESLQTIDQRLAGGFPRPCAERMGSRRRSRFHKKPAVI